MINELKRDIPLELHITEEAAERICCAIIQWRNCQGFLTNWGGDINEYIMACFQRGSPLVIHIDRKRP